MRQRNNEDGAPRRESGIILLFPEGDQRWYFSSEMLQRCQYSTVMRYNDESFLS